MLEPNINNSNRDNNEEGILEVMLDTRDLGFTMLVLSYDFLAYRSVLLFNSLNERVLPYFDVSKGFTYHIDSVEGDDKSFIPF